MSEESRAHFRAGTHSQIGAGHLVDSTPNQDGATWSQVDDRVVVAVADGHGDLLHIRSDRGSKMAVEAARTRVMTELSSLERAGAEQVESAMRQVFVSILDEWRRRVDEDLARAPVAAAEFEGKTAGADETDRLLKEIEGTRLAYGTTLLVAAASPTGLWCWRLGDGDAVVVDDTGEVAALFPDETEDVTHSLCETEPAKWLEVCHLRQADRPLRLAMLSTDGYRKSYDRAEDFLAVPRDMAAKVQSHGFDAVLDKLPGWLKHVTANGSGDDVSAALIWRRPTQAAAPTPPAHERPKDVPAAEPAGDSDVSPGQSAAQQQGNQT